jgi:hypothetical protein
MYFLCRVMKLYVPNKTMVYYVIRSKNKVLCAEIGSQST